MQEYEKLIKEGNFSIALDELKNAIRKKPADSSLRILLFQVYAFLEEWDKATLQLNVARDMAGDIQLFASLYSQAVLCEKFRVAVFAGEKTPVIFGEPEEWIALMIQAIQLVNQKRYQDAADLNISALSKAPTVSGEIDNKKFDWFMDMDSRIGPLLEAIMNGTYYWIPFSYIKKIVIKAPEHLIDCIWNSASITLKNGTLMDALLPVRYVNSSLPDNVQIVAGKYTEWQELSKDYYQGVGQKMFTTGADDYAILEMREIVFN